MFDFQGKKKWYVTKFPYLTEFNLIITHLSDQQNEKKKFYKMHIYFREAWKSLENKTREEAMKEYISKVTLTVPDWNLVGVLYYGWRKFIKVYQNSPVVEGQCGFISVNLEITGYRIVLH